MNDVKQSDCAPGPANRFLKLPAAICLAIVGDHASPLSVGACKFPAAKGTGPVRFLLYCVDD